MKHRPVASAVMVLERFQSSPPVTLQVPRSRSSDLDTQ